MQNVGNGQEYFSIQMVTLRWLIAAKFKKKITNLAFYFKVCENNFEFADFNLQFAKHDL